MYQGSFWTFWRQGLVKRGELIIKRAVEEAWKMVDLIKMAKYSMHKITNTVQKWGGEKKKRQGGGSRCNWRWDSNLNQIQELREGSYGWGIADFLVGLLMLLDGKIRKNEKAEKDPEGIWVGEGRKASIISFHGRINNSKLSIVVDHRCEYCAGEDREELGWWP